MSNSALATVKIMSPNHSGQRTHPITKIAIHHMAGDLSVETCGRIFLDENRYASSNYGIGSDGRVALYVDENNRSWCTSSAWCDNRAITIEVANSEYGGQWRVSGAALSKLIELCVDICKRNGITDCTYTGDKDGVLQKHLWYDATACPGPYLGGQFEYIAKEVNKRLNSTPTSPSTTTTLTVGMSVKIKASAMKYVTGEQIPDFVKERNYPIIELDGQEVLLGEIMSWVWANDIVGQNTYTKPQATSKPAPEAPEAPKVTLKMEEVPIKTVTLKPHIRLNKDTNLWAFDKAEWTDITAVKPFKKGDELEVAAIVTNRLGGKYYVTPYSYENKVMNGINVVDAELFYK